MSAAAGRNVMILDGPTGTELTARGFRAEAPLWTARAAIDAPDLLRAIHLDYLNAGAQLITANTFRTSSYSMAKSGLNHSEAAELARRLTHASVAVATEAIESLPHPDACAPRFVAGSLAPLEDCYYPRLVPQLSVLEKVHFETAGWLVEAGCDVVLVETMGTAREAMVAVRAAKKAGAPSIIVSFITDSAGEKLLGGDSLRVTAHDCVASGAEAVLVNCVHPDAVDKALSTLKELAESGIVLGAYANASKMNVAFDGTVTWDEDSRSLSDEEKAAEYAERAATWHRKYRAMMIGSCCGTGPLYIRKLAEKFSR